MSKDIPKGKGAKSVAAKDDGLGLQKLDVKLDPKDKTSAKAKTPEEIEAEKKNPKKPEENSDKIEQFTAGGWSVNPKDTDSLQFRTPKYPDNKEPIKDQNIQQLAGNEWKKPEQTPDKATPKK